MRRKGMMKGRGRGYKNVMGKDPYVHSQSAKGIKQPQRIPHIPMPIKKKVNLYVQLSDATQKEVNNFPMQFAFSDEQLEEGLKKLGVKKEDIVSIGAGGFIRKTDRVKYNNLITKHNKEHDEMLQNKDYVYQMFRYELANHEYCITHDENETLQSVGLTREEINKNPMWAEQLTKAKKDYLNSSGDC